MRKYGALSLAAALAAMPGLAHAQETLADAADSGDTAWILTSSALVLLMVMPGLTLFYGGLLRTKNVLSVMIQCGAIAGLGRCCGSSAATPWHLAQ